MEIRRFRAAGNCRSFTANSISVSPRGNWIWWLREKAEEVEIRRFRAAAKCRSFTANSISVSPSSIFPPLQTNKFSVILYLSQSTIYNIFRIVFYILFLGVYIMSPTTTSGLPNPFDRRSVDRHRIFWWSLVEPKLMKTTRDIKRIYLDTLRSLFMLKCKRKK